MQILAFAALVFAGDQVNGGCAAGGATLLRTIELIDVENLKLAEAARQQRIMAVDTNRTYRACLDTTVSLSYTDSVDECGQKFAAVSVKFVFTFVLYI